MTTTAPPAARVAEALAEHPLAELVDGLEELTDELRTIRTIPAPLRNVSVEVELVTVRGWIIAELDRRDAAALDRFLLDRAPLRVAFGLEEVRP